MAVVQGCFLNAHLCKVAGCSIVKRVQLELAAVCVCVYLHTQPMYECAAISTSSSTVLVLA